MSGNVGNQPFHEGEIELQTQLGVHEMVMQYAPRFIRDHLPDQHRQFYASLPMLLVGSLDFKGRPWASAVFGRPGFLHSPDPYTLRVQSQPVFGDPLHENLALQAPLGFLGLEYHSRRRNRLTGKVTDFSRDGFDIQVDQAFGNCPQYIEARAFELLPSVDQPDQTRVVQKLDKLNKRAKEIISAATSFFITTHYSDDPENPTHGTDASHRGGRAGFVKVLDDVNFAYPEFSGNNHYNTLGNLIKNPLAGLLFPDFSSGDLLYITCKAEIVWDSEEVRAFRGAHRMVKFRLDEGLLVEKAMPLRWQFIEESANFATLGSWQEVALKTQARQTSAAEREYLVKRVVRESRSIRSYYLETLDGEPVPSHVAGQFLPVRIRPQGMEKDQTRTYTISNGPNGGFLRLSIKHESGVPPHKPPGLISSEFHQRIKSGSVIRALKPSGKFNLAETSTRPVVLLSAGVGITPMISMLEHLVSQGNGGSEAQVYFIHGARNGVEHAFADHVHQMAKENPWIQVHFRYSQPLPTDQLGKDHHDTGYVDIDLLKSKLPTHDCDFYLCGPQPFMRDLYAGLRAMNINQERIHYEFFGKGSIYGDSEPGERVEPEIKAPVQVRFDTSGVEVTWKPGAGSLLDLAESAGLTPAFNCRSGICKTCTTRVLSGDVVYDNSQQGAEMGKQALICCAYPKPGTTLVLDV